MNLRFKFCKPQYKANSVIGSLVFDINSCVDLQITTVFFIACIEKASQHCVAARGMSNRFC